MRLPVFGQSAKLIERNDETTSRKGYLSMKDQEFYTSQKGIVNSYFGIPNIPNHKYVLDPAATLAMRNHAT